jgi:drug/metabolite transporter (DMT)-like permease
LDRAVVQERVEQKVEQRSSIAPAVWAALTVVYLVWGSTYLGIRVLVRSAPPLLSAGARFLIAGLVLAAIVAARDGVRSLRVSGRQLAACALLGLLLPLAGNGLVTLAERDVASGVAALVIAVVPLYVVLLRAATGDRPPLATLIGVLLGFAGIAVLADPHGGAKTSGVVLLLLASLAWSFGSWVQARLPLPRDPVVVTAWEMATGGAAMMVVGLLHGEPGDRPISGITAQGWSAFAYLTVFGSLLGFTAYVWVLQNAPISLVATYAYVNPAVAVLLGTLLLDEPLTGRLLIGGVVVLAAVAVVVGAESRSRRQPDICTAPEPVVAD